MLARNLWWTSSISLVGDGLNDAARLSSACQGDTERTGDNTGSLAAIISLICVQWFRMNWKRMNWVFEFKYEWTSITKFCWIISFGDIISSSPSCRRFESSKYIWYNTDLSRGEQARSDAGSYICWIHHILLRVGDDTLQMVQEKLNSSIRNTPRKTVKANHSSIVVGFRKRSHCGLIKLKIELGRRKPSVPQNEWSLRCSGTLALAVSMKDG